MEKAMSVEERIRRAEEIYNRRNQDSYYISNSNSKERKSKSLKYRMIKQIIICMMVYGLFYVVTNREYFMSEDFQESLRYYTSKNEYINNAYNYVTGYLNKYLKINTEEQDKKSSKELSGENQNENEKDTNEEKKMQENEENINKDDNQKNDENIGGAETSEKEKMTQEEKDVEEIKNTVSFINPIEGRISSTFGWRNPTTASVPKYHTGLDIAASTGTKIKSATDGKIVLASAEGDYGNHYKIQINDLTIIYAHCSKLYFQEGKEIKQGQEIAEVGSTGNSTGPHLHFEIRKEERLINPELILDV